MKNYFICKLCDKTIKIKSKKEHLNSRDHKYLSESIIFRYIILNPDFIKVDEILSKFVNIYNKTYEQYEVRCLLKSLTKKMILNISELLLNLTNIIHIISC